jgi:hypothetical protein
MIMDDDLERMWRKVLTQHMAGRTEEKQETSVMISSYQLGFEPDTS